MKVFLFPGQGSQEIGMASDLFKADEAFRELVRRASEHTGVDLEKICLRGPERDLTRTKNLQPLLVCVSLGYLRRLWDAGVRPELAMGHSLGEISALAAAGVVSFETAVDIAAKRGELMDAAATRTPGGMSAVMTQGDLEPLIARLAERFPAPQIVLATDNAPGQFVISGEFIALEQAEQFIAAEKLGRCRRLDVAGPWHSPLMEPARREFAEWLGTIEFHEPKVPVIFNVTAATENAPKNIRSLVARNLVEPVRWRAALERFRETDNLSLFEVGPGRVLSGLARANGVGAAAKIVNVNNLRGVELAGRTR